MLSSSLLFASHLKAQTQINFFRYKRGTHRHKHRYCKKKIKARTIVTIAWHMVYHVKDFVKQNVADIAFGLWVRKIKKQNWAEDILYVIESTYGLFEFLNSFNATTNCDVCRRRVVVSLDMLRRKSITSMTMLEEVGVVKEEEIKQQKLAKSFFKSIEFLLIFKNIFVPWFSHCAINSSYLITSE